MCGVRFEFCGGVSEESDHLGYHTLSVVGTWCLKGTQCLCLLGTIWKPLTFADEGITFLENGRNHFPMDTTSYPKDLYPHCTYTCACQNISYQELLERFWCTLIWMLYQWRTSMFYFCVVGNIVADVRWVGFDTGTSCSM